jgi:hypothetical protein
LFKSFTHWNTAVVKNTLLNFVSVGIFNWCNDCGGDCLLLCGCWALCITHTPGFDNALLSFEVYSKVIGIYHWVWAFALGGGQYLIVCNFFALDALLQYSQVHVCMYS